MKDRLKPKMSPEGSTTNDKAPINCIGPSNQCNFCPLRDSDCQIAYLGRDDFSRRLALKDLLGD